MDRNIAKKEKRILIVDDEPAVRRTVRSALESAGYECAESENGSAALAWLEENQVDAIVTDYDMPELGGLKLLERLSGRGTGKFPPVIMLTGSVEDKDKMKARALGAYAVVEKPCNFRELVITVGEALNL
jgi:two-component system chemotaxis response regulator CheY